MKLHRKEDAKMQKCKVVNLRKERYDAYIGRGSKWGNKFVIGRDGYRAEVKKNTENGFWIIRNC